MEPGDAKRERIEIFAAILMGVATIVSAFCGYQATLWGGDQAAHLAEATNRQFAAMHKRTAADREVLVDVATFFNLQQAMVRHDERMIRFIRANARLEFRRNLEAWYQAVQADPDDGASPFESRSYRVADAAVADRLHASALEETVAAAEANAAGDRWVLHTVVATLALFFLGIATQAPARLVRRMTLTFGALTLAAMIASATRLPRSSGEVGGASEDKPAKLAEPSGHGETS